MHAFGPAVPDSCSKVRPVNSSQVLLKKVQSLSKPETQIITGAVSAIFRNRSSLSRSASFANSDWVNASLRICRMRATGTAATIMAARIVVQVAIGVPGV